MEESRIEKEARFINNLILGLKEYAKKYSCVLVDESTKKDCKVEIVHRENGLIVLYTEYSV